MPGPWRIVTPICYGAVCPAFARRVTESARPHWIVTPTHDACFGETPPPWIHRALAPVHGVAHRRNPVRAAQSAQPDGPSARVVQRRAVP